MPLLAVKELKVEEKVFFCQGLSLNSSQCKSQLSPNSKEQGSGKNYKLLTDITVRINFGIPRDVRIKTVKPEALRIRSKGTCI